MKIRIERITEKTAGFSDIVDLTPKLQRKVAESGLRRGLLTAFVSGSTAGLTTIEFEPGLVADLKELLERWVPSDRRYRHDDRWQDDNGFSHLRAALFGPSLSIPVEDGRLVLGTWQQVVLLDFDNRPRTREILVQIIGETRD